VTTDDCWYWYLTYVEICALGPSQAMRWRWKRTVRIEPTARSILTGASPHGQGQETAFCTGLPQTNSVSIS